MRDLRFLLLEVYGMDGDGMGVCFVVPAVEIVGQRHGVSENN